MVHTAFHSHRIHVIKCLRKLSLPYKLIVFLAISNAQLEIETKKSRNMNPLTVFLLCLFGVYSGRFTHPLIVSFCVSLEVIQIGLSIIKILIIYEQYNYLRLKNNQIWKNYIFYSLRFSTQEFFYHNQNSQRCELLCYLWIIFTILLSLKIHRKY